MCRFDAPATARLFGAAAVAAILSCGLALHPARAQDAADAAEPHEGLSDDELARKLANPVSSVWSMQLQNNMTFLRGDPSSSYRGQFTSNLQPVLPLHLTDEWNLIVRPVFNFTSTPTLDSSGDFDRANGVGQTSLITLLSPRKSEGLLWGVGPTFIIPTTREMS